MIGCWRTPDGKLHKVDDLEHIEYAYEKGWLDDFLKNNPMPEDNAETFDDDPYYEWLNKAKKYLFGQDYIRSRYFKDERGPGDLAIQGNIDYLNPDIVESFLKIHNLPLDSLITVENDDGIEVLSKGTLSDWLKMYRKRMNPNNC